MNTNSNDQKAEIIGQTKKLIDYTRNDLESFNSIQLNAGNCSVGMISHAMALIDWLSYLHFGERNDPDRKVKARINKLLSKYKPYAAHDLWKKTIHVIDSKKPSLIYHVLRCGVIHQFYGKSTFIKRYPDKIFLFCRDENSNILINPDGLINMALHILVVSLNWIDGMDANEVSEAFERNESRKTKDLSILNMSLTNSFIEILDCPISPTPEVTKPYIKPDTQNSIPTITSSVG